MTLRLALVGCAGHVSEIRRGLGEFPEASLCAVAAGGTGESLEAVRAAAGAGAVTGYADFRQMLERERPDVVAVTPEFHRHAEVSAEALRRGLAVYSEKPLSLTHEGLAAVRAARAASGAALGTMFAFRYLPAYAAAHRLAREGAIGRPTVGYAQKSYKRGLRADFYRRRETFGGIIPWVGIHAIDWFRWISGLEYRAVSAAHVKLHAPDYPGMEDAATCLFELANGGSAAMSFDFLRPAGAPTHGDDRLRLLGEAGALEIRGAAGLELITKDGPREVPGDASALGPFADFLKSVADPRHTCRVSPEDALRVTEVCLKARDAADRGERVAL